MLLEHPRVYSIAAPSESLYLSIAFGTPRMLQMFGWALLNLPAADAAAAEEEEEEEKEETRLLLFLLL